MGVLVDAGKVRTKGKEWIDTESKRRYNTEFRDAKIAAVSRLGWDANKQEAFCEQNSYVSGIEYADEFFRRIRVEMNRRCNDVSKLRLAFLGDGALWIWDRVGDLSNETSIYILDFYHAIEHLSDLCKKLLGQQTKLYQQHYRKWVQMFWQDEVQQVIKQLKQIRDGPLRESKGDDIQKQIDYFEDNKSRMLYKSYREMGLPISSRTVESGCKNVIAKRLKQSGMTWTVTAARGMMQIRSSIKSRRFKKDFRSVLPLLRDDSELPEPA